MAPLKPQPEPPSVFPMVKDLLKVHSAKFPDAYLVPSMYIELFPVLL